MLIIMIINVDLNMYNVSEWWWTFVFLSFWLNNGRDTVHFFQLRLSGNRIFGWNRDIWKLMKFEHHPFRGKVYMLVGGLEHFFRILGIIIPTDELIFFGGVGTPPNQYVFWWAFPITCAMTWLRVETPANNAQVRSLRVLTAGWTEADGGWRPVVVFQLVTCWNCYKIIA